MSNVKKIRCLIGTVLFGLLVFVFVFIIRLADWYRAEFKTAAFSVVVYQLSTPLTGAGQERMDSMRASALYVSIVIAVVLTVLYLAADMIFVEHDLNLDVRLKDRIRSFLIRGTTALKVKKVISGLLLISLCATIVNRAFAVGIPQYIDEISHNSTIYEDRYVDPQTVQLTFPENRRNLILIFLESMEASFIDRGNGGISDVNYIPELTQIALDNVSFSTGDKLGGFHIYGMGFTMAGILAATAGVNYKLPVYNLNANIYAEVLPGITNLGDILEAEGYGNYYLCGSYSSFSGKKAYLKGHGNYEVMDLSYAYDAGHISGDYYNDFWGYEDMYLYEIAKKELDRISSLDEPFNLTMLTVDTHMPEGYVCDLCKDEFDTQYGNVLACASRQLADFLNWAKTQKWYDDTTIVIMGDHPTMATNFRITEETNEYDVYDREVYNCFINCSEGLDLTHMKNREFSTCDMFPTILASMGVDIQGDRLALGTNLFSGIPTLPESMGKDEFYEQLQMNSKYYTKVFVEGSR